jgi:hypothetical protein
LERIEERRKWDQSDRVRERRERRSRVKVEEREGDVDDAAKKSEGGLGEMRPIGSPV